MKDLKIEEKLLRMKKWNCLTEIEVADGMIEESTTKISKTCDIKALIKIKEKICTVNAQHEKSPATSSKYCNKIKL